MWGIVTTCIVHIHIILCAFLLVGDSAIVLIVHSGQSFILVAKVKSLATKQVGSSTAGFAVLRLGA